MKLVVARAGSARPNTPTIESPFSNCVELTSTGRMRPSALRMATLPSEASVVPSILAANSCRASVRYSRSTTWPSFRPRRSPK